MSALRAIRTEWTKLRTLPSTGWLLLVAVAGTAGLGLAITGSLNYDHCGTPCTLDTVKLTFSGVRLGQVGVVVLAILAVTAEYSTRTIQPTLMGVPRRSLVVLGKVAVLTVLGLGAGVVAVAGSLVAGRIMLPDNGFTAPSLADELTRRSAAGTVLYIGLLTLLGAGLGLLLRDTAGAVTAALALLYGSPVVALFVGDPRWQHRIHRFSPMDAGLAIQATRDFSAQHIGPWGGLGVLSLYAAGAVIAGLVMFELRDAR